MIKNLESKPYKERLGKMRRRLKEDIGLLTSCW